MQTGNLAGSGVHQTSKKRRHFLDHLRFSIQTKITLPYVILSLLIAFGGVFLISEYTMGAIKSRFNNSLIETSMISADMMVNEENLVLETQRLIAYTDSIDQAIYSQDAEALREIILPLAFNGMEDVVVILDANGKNLLTLENVSQTEKPMYEATRDNPSFQQLAMVQSVLNRQTDSFGDKFAGMVILGETPTFFVSGPIFDDEGNFAGVSMVGTYVNNIIRRMRQETLAQITIYDFNGNILVSTLNHQQPLSPELVKLSIEAQDETSTLRDFIHNDITFRENISPWEVREKMDIGLIGVSFSTNFLTQTSATTRWQIAAFTSILLFLTVVTGIWVGRLITSPIKKLRSAAVNIADGDLSTQVETGSHDELEVLADTFNNMANNLKLSKQELIKAYDLTLIGWSKALELKDRETTGHTLRVTKITAAIAQRFGYQGEELEFIKRGAMLHDIGKMGIPDSILKKPGKLTPEEYNVVKRHPQYAFDILSKISFLHPAITIPYCHHERWDGTGYPRGLKGQEIPLHARIFAVVDVWDAVSSDRVYHKALPLNKAYELILAGAGTHFDPRVVKEFIRYLDEEHLTGAEVIR